MPIEDLAQRGLGRALPIGVGGVEEVDAGVERGVGAGPGLRGLRATGLRQP